MNSGARISESQPAALSPGGREGTSSGSDKQDTPWINVFSVVSRPALSLLQKYLPGILQTRSLTDSISEWVSEDLKPTLSGKEVAYLGQLGDIMPLTERSQHVGRLFEPRSESNLKWLTAESLSELGIKHAGDIDKQPIMGDFSSARNLAHVLLDATSSAEATSHLLSDCRSHTWWGGFWGSEDGSQSWLSKLSLDKGEGGAHCSPSQGGTKSAVAQTTALFVQFSSWESMASENAGHSSNTQQPVDNGSLENPQPESPKCSDALVLRQEPGTNGTNISAGAATVFSQVAVLTPEQDNGYSSLEEGHALCQPHMVEVIAKEELQVAAYIPVVETETSEPAEGPSSAAKGMEEKGAEGDVCEVGGSEEDGGGGETTTQEGSSTAGDMLTSPYCQNRAISFIMGGPCSDDDDDDADSLSDSELSDCDDGFDSECSSEISDFDSDDSDSRIDSEAERLWNSLCQTQDPYNLHNFTAPMNTAPRPIPSTSAAAACSPDSSPDSSPDQGSAPPVSLSLSVSPPALQHPDSWDDSTSASEAEDADSLCLWNSFSSSSDPYSLLNFQAPVRTERPLAEVQEEEGCQGKKKSLKITPRSAHQAAAASSSPQYRREEAEDRLDSGFSEPPAHAATTLVTSQSCLVFKKVRFCEEVEEFFTSSREDEDRRGQWEELARDRCRFSRRCHDVEQSISYCLEPQHRTLVYQRITVSYDLQS